MESNNALITELNQKIDSYLENEEYDKAEETCKDLCRIQGLKPAEQIPEDFLYQLKQKERKNMKKTTKRLSGIAAAVAVAVLLIGGTVSAAVIYNNSVHFSIKGLIAGDDMAIVYNSENGEITEINLPEMSEDSIISPISEEKGSADTLWLSKKVWDDTYEVYDSDDAVNWTKGYQTTRITEYRYADYFTAAEDAGFEKLFRTNYTGDVVYYEYEDLDAEKNMDYSIAGEFSYGSGHFNINQQKFPTYGSNEVNAEEAPALMLITTTGETANEREYLSSSGISFKMSDDTEFGYTRTTTLFRGNSSDTVLEFIGMTEEEIHEVLDNIQP